MEVQNQEANEQKELIEKAKEYIKQGLSVIPANTAKEPAGLSTWKEYKTAPATPDKIEALIKTSNAPYIAIIGGYNRLEIIDVDCKYDLTGKLWENLKDLIEDNIPELLDSFIVSTVSGGYHIYYKCQQIEGNKVLARRPATAEEKAIKERVFPLIETRGAGGYVIAPPSKGYKALAGTADQIKEITPEQRTLLFNLCKSFDEMPQEQPRQKKEYTEKPAGLSPIDDYNQRGEVIELLEKHSYRITRTQGDRVYLLRPGETKSKTSGNYRTDLRLLRMFSSSTEFNPEQAYNASNVFSILECNEQTPGKETYKRLLALGYGEALQTHDTQHTQETQEEQEETKEEYLKTSTDYYLNGFMNGIKESVNTPATPTGFKSLDKALEGGLYEGLYTIGAMSGLGKTTYILQIADQIAKAGQDVLYISLEMARTELMAKSISRLTLLQSKDNRKAKTARGITEGKRYLSYSEEDKETIQTAIKGYGDFAGRLYIREGIGDIGIKQIKTFISNHVKYTGNKPIVIIDYLQIIEPYNIRGTDKQNIDKAVLELKKISRDYKITVFIVSSFNRDNYKKTVSFEAFKESGNIEYTSDVVLGMQLKGVGQEGFDKDKEQEKNPREIEIKILKNRNGKAGQTLSYNYYPAFHYIEDAEA
jgi:replicative DNA helicase